MNKYNYYQVIQQNYGSGFEDVDTHECKSNGTMSTEARKVLRCNVKAYRENTNYATRIIFRRELRT